MKVSERRALHQRGALQRAFVAAPGKAVCSDSREEENAVSSKRFCTRTGHPRMVEFTRSISHENPFRLDAYGCFYVTVP